MRVDNSFFVIVITCLSFLSCHTNDKSLGKGILLEAPINYAECGVVSNLVAFKFRELDSRREFLLFVPCPELYGDNYFLKGEAYHFDTVKNKSVYKDYVLLNKYGSEGLISYYVYDIKKINSK